MAYKQFDEIRALFPEQKPLVYNYAQGREIVLGLLDELDEITKILITVTPVLDGDTPKALLEDLAMRARHRLSGLAGYKERSHAFERVARGEIAICALCANCDDKPLCKSCVDHEAPAGYQYFKFDPERAGRMTEVAP
ncbi:MAG: hypothetical protein FWE19_00470 [Oscillospiraceae bacterium]|nr:hypothetical protein [Oscillospiraceae bacterium]